uniref:O-phosphoseryl-tRNA(Sec) selenium transferase n=1 Tax=Emiliania huxleyi TaxID=2903 RepID=A0A7S3SP59_EMIHU
MNDQIFDLAQGLVPANYIKQARQARQARESLLKTLLAQRRLPEHGWDEPTLKLALAELAALDSNTFVGNAGVGEREGRVICPLVAARHFGLAHGIGRSGDIAEAQPKAAGSSLIYALTNALAADALRRAGGAGVSECVTLPLATGMSVTLTLLALRQLRPNARHVLWPRIDQKSCLKAVSAAGLTPVPIENLLDGDELRTDLDALAAKLSEIGADDVLCVLTTTSCFAPRGVDKLLDVARLCAEQGVPHLCNNAYGVQCDRCMKAIASASRHGRLDCFIQSTDKNFLVPVGGAIVATADGRHGPELLAKVRSTYAGRASISPVLDLFCTLLHLGADGWLRLLERRRASFPDFRRKLEAVAAKHGERVLHTPNNGISMSVTLTPPEGSKPAGSLGASLFVRLVSGLRVVTPSAAGKTVGGIPFESYGAHYSGYPCAYFSVACAIGIADGDVDLFLRRLDKALAEWKKPPRQPKAKAGGADGAAGNGSCAAKDRDLAKDFRPNPSAKEFVPAAQPAPCMTAAPPCSAEKAEEKGVAAE